MPTRKRSSRIVIIGAGVGGISTGIALKRKYGASFDDFMIYEKASDVGGTWRENIYPGCYSDVAIDFYSHSQHISASWPETYGAQPVIQDYWKSLTTKHFLWNQIVFNATILSATWNNDEQQYTIVIEVNGERSTTTAQILVSAVGVLDIPNDNPEIDGLGSFQGDVWHSARWRNDVSLSGKRVGVIGNGASATQFVPIITKDKSTTITQFIRTPGWLFPPLVSRISRPTMWLKRHLPLFARTIRLAKFILHEALWALLYFSTLRHIVEKGLKYYMLFRAPERYHEHLIPAFSLGCKRILFNTSYLQSLHAPNLTLDHVGIKYVVKDGIVVNDGTFIPLDIIILATGFVTVRGTAGDWQLLVLNDIIRYDMQNTMPVTITNAKGRTVSDYYVAKGGAQAYRGTMIPGFPNLFILAGPNTATGHTSVIFSEEVQINYMMQLIAPILASVTPIPSMTSVAPTEKATEAYNTTLHKYLKKSVWSGCVSWYRAQGHSKDEKDQKVSAIFPGPATLWWYLLRKPRLSDFEFTWRYDDGLELKEGVDGGRGRVWFLVFVVLCGLLGVGLWVVNI